MSTFLYLMINSFIMLTQRKFIWFYTHIHKHITLVRLHHCVCVCVRKANLSVSVYILQRKCSEKYKIGGWHIICWLQIILPIYKMQPCTRPSSSSSSSVWFSQLLLCCCAPADQFTTFFFTTMALKMYPIINVFC